MTLLAEVAAPGVDRDVVEQQFTEVYAANFSRVVRYAGVFLDWGQTALAEDMAQEAFIQLWKGMLRGQTYHLPTVYGLLKLYVRRAVAEYYKPARSSERSVDFADPVNTPIVASGHGYATGVPGLASVVRDLDHAMVVMARASERWRNLNKESAAQRLKLADHWKDHLGGLSATARARIEREAEEIEQREDQALIAFRASCLRVGQLRAEIEAAAGPNWRSSIGLPPSQVATAPFSYAKDPTATHCSKGHLLDRLTTAYTAAGERRCRVCGRENTARAKPRTGKVATTDPQIIEQARDLIVTANHTIPAAAEAVGVSPMTLYRAFPGGVKAVRQAAELAGATR